MKQNKVPKVEYHKGEPSDKKPSPYRYDRIVDETVVNDSMGYWNPDNFGKIVQFSAPDGRVSMNNVNFPVMAISNKGEYNMQMPGQEYQYKGDFITEYPMAKNGGWLDSLPMAQKGKIKTPEGWKKEIRAVEKRIGDPSTWTLDSYKTLQDKLNEYKTWRENTAEGKAVVDYHNEPNEYVVPLPEHLRNKKNGGGLLNKTLTCPSCGWSWKAVDGGKDIATCHKCGGTAKLAYGGDLPMAQKGKTHKDSVAHQADKILKYEQLRGGPGGTPLSYYGEPKYKKILMDEVYPEVNKIMPNASAIEKGEAMDLIFNAGWDTTAKKILVDPRAYALQEYYRKNDESKLDAKGKWPGRKGDPYSFDQEYKKTIENLPENERRVLMNKGRDWFYQNRAPKKSNWDLEKQGPYPDYANTWYGRIWNTNNYSEFDPKNPKFTYRKKAYGGDPSLPNIEDHYPFGGQNSKTGTHFEEGGWLDKMQDGASVIPKLRHQQDMADAAEAAANFKNSNRVSSTAVNKFIPKFTEEDIAVAEANKEFAKLPKAQQDAINMQNQAMYSRGPEAQLSQGKKLTKEEQDYSDKVKARIANPAADIGILAGNMASALSRGHYLTPEEIASVTNNPMKALGLSSEMATFALANEMAVPLLQKAISSVPKKALSTKAGKYLTTKTPLKNAYKLNPSAIKENPEMYLYRAEPSNFNSQSTIDFMKQEVAAGKEKPWYKATIKSYEEGHPKLMAQNDFHGQWLEKDPARLDWYLNSGDKVDAGTPMSIFRTKIPTSEAAKYNVANIKKANVISASPETEFVMPRNIIEQGEKFPASSWQQLIQQDKTFNTPHWLKGYPEVPIELPGSPNKKSISTNLEDLAYTKKWAKQYGYELPKNLERIAQSDELTNRTVRGMMNRHNTFVRGISTNWEEIGKRNPQVLQHLEDIGIDYINNPKAAAEYMATHIPGDTGYGRFGLKPDENAIYLSNSNPTAEGYTYGQGYTVKVKKPTDFSSENRQDWLINNDFDAHLGFKGSPFGEGIVKNDYIKRFPVGLRETLAATGDPNKMVELQKIVQEKEALYNELGHASWKKYNNLIDDLKYKTSAETRNKFLRWGDEGPEEGLRDVPNLFDKLQLKYLKNKKDLMQKYYHVLPLKDIVKGVYGDPDIWKALGKNMFGKLDPFSHYAIKGQPGEKVLEAIHFKEIKPELWNNKSRAHINVSSKGLTRRKNGGWLDDMDEEYRRGGQRRRRGTSKNIQSSINDLFRRNYDVYGPAGKNRYNPTAYKTGGWLDNVD